MKTTLIAVLIWVMPVMSAFAADNLTGSPVQGVSVEQKKTSMLQRIEERIILSQQEKVCVQTAVSHADLMACREKFRPRKPGEDRKNNNRGQ